jgi:hypothetical protein
VAAIKRMSHGWQLNGSFSTTKSDAPVAPQSAYNPNADINMGANYWEWNGKVSGAYAAPLGLMASFNFDARSGNPTARTVLFRGGVQIPSVVLNVDPIGSLHLPNTYLLDFRLEKNFSLTGSQKLAVRANLYNATNTNAVTVENVRSGASYLLPTAIVPPRFLEFSVNYLF